jgi:hypothetical protein
MKKSILTSAIMLTLSTSALADNHIPFESVELKQEVIRDSATISAIDPVTMSTIGGWILSGAKSAIKSGVKSFLKDALFGSSGPSYVMLHEDALRQIEDIVTEVVLNSDVEDAKSLLFSFKDLLSYYNASAQDNQPDVSLLPSLVSYATSLKNHQAYRASYNSNAHLLTGSYSLVSALTIAVLAEKELRNEIDHSYVKTVANQLHSTLTNLGAKANSYISTNIRMSYPTSGCDNVIIHSIDDTINNEYDDSTEELKLLNDINIELGNEEGTLLYRNCSYTVYDKIASKTYRFEMSEFGKQFASRLAHNKLNNLNSMYQAKFKGSDYSEIVNHLNTY